MRTIVVFLLLLCSLAFAAVGDIAPAPEPPDITVTFTKDGQPYLGRLSVIYVCTYPGGANDSAVGQREVTLACQMGVCTNEDWFYKFNPCFDAHSGYFKYKLADESSYRKTGDVSFGSEGGTLTIDLDTGITSKPSAPEPTCLPAFLLLAMLGFLLIRWD